MAKEKMISVRLSAEELKMVDFIVLKMNQTSKEVGFSLEINQSDALRVALAEFAKSYGYVSE